MTLPLLRPVTLFLVVWSSINALQLFDEVYLATKAGPGRDLVPVSLSVQAGVRARHRGVRRRRLRVVRGDLAPTMVQLVVGKRMVYYAS